MRRSMLTCYMWADSNGISEGRCVGGESACVCACACCACACVGGGKDKVEAKK